MLIQVKILVTLIAPACDDRHGSSGPPGFCACCWAAWLLRVLLGRLVIDFLFWRPVLSLVVVVVVAIVTNQILEILNMKLECKEPKLLLDQL